MHAHSNAPNSHTTAGRTRSLTAGQTTDSCVPPETIPPSPLLYSYHWANSAPRHPGMVRGHKHDLLRHGRNDWQLHPKKLRLVGGFMRPAPRVPWAPPRPRPAWRCRTLPRECSLYQSSADHTGGSGRCPRCSSGSRLLTGGWGGVGWAGRRENKNSKVQQEEVGGGWETTGQWNRESWGEDVRTLRTARECSSILFFDMAEHSTARRYPRGDHAPHRLNKRRLEWLLQRRSVLRTTWQVSDYLLRPRVHGHPEPSSFTE